MNIGQSIKNKIGNKLHFIYKRLFANHQYNFYLSRYRFNNVDNKTLDELKYFSETKYCWETCSNRLWLLYITILLENNENESIDILVKKYLYFYGLKNVEEFFVASYWFYNHGLTNEKIEKAAKIYKKILDSTASNKFPEQIRNKKIAVVGNSPNMLGKNKGNEIDNHDIVIRFNEFYTKGYEKDYGVKCDFWANYFSNKDFLKYKERPDCTLLWTNNAFVFSDHVGLENAYSCIDKNWVMIPKIRRYVWENLNLCCDPTSGFIVIMYLYDILKSFENVDFYGFKFLDDDKTVMKHHYFKTMFVNDYKAHDIDNEAKFLKIFISQKK